MADPDCARIEHRRRSHGTLLAGQYRHARIADHGPTGEYQDRTGGDEIDVGRKGDDLGWPTAWLCDALPGLVAPVRSTSPAAS